MSEADWMAGRRAAWVNMLRTCLRELGYQGDEAEHVKWIAEREEAVAQLREVCATHGDNDWPETLHLGDVIDKHLAKHLG